LTYNTARKIADILPPLVGKNGYALKNSAELVEQLSQCKLDEADVMVLYDVTSLFTRVPVDRSLDVIFDKLNKDNTLDSRTNMSPSQVHDLLAICLKTTYFMFDGTIYAQVEGAAMGSPVSPIVANLFMEWFEKLAIRTFPYEIVIWKRYVDDTIVALCDSLIQDFTTYLNSIYPSIQFT
jgi:retron-type reverse transcriptase